MIKTVDARARSGFDSGRAARQSTRCTLACAMVHTSQHGAPSASAKSPVLKLGSVSIDAFLPTKNAGPAPFFAHKNTSGIGEA